MGNVFSADIYCGFSHCNVHLLAHEGRTDELRRELDANPFRFYEKAADPTIPNLVSITVEQGHIHTLSMLIKKGCDLNLPDVCSEGPYNAGITPLMVAAMTPSRGQFLKFLLGIV